jgi:hypothetical protein
VRLAQATVLAISQEDVGGAAILLLLTVTSPTPPTDYRPPFCERARSQINTTTLQELLPATSTERSPLHCRACTARCWPRLVVVMAPVDLFITRAPQVRQAQDALSLPIGKGHMLRQPGVKNSINGKLECFAIWYIWRVLPVGKSGSVSIGSLRSCHLAHRSLAALKMDYPSQ